VSDLNGAILSCTNLSAADLIEAGFIDAKLEGATMPDGKKYKAE
jgi:uncharacterized protein YjbI with pentapeptide repeats